jgi:hypothetical protein
MPGETEAAPTFLPEPPEEPTASEEPILAEALPTAEEAAVWLGQIKPAAVVALLKDPDYRMAVAPAFTGFRPDTKSFALPLVRSRLAQAASKDNKLAKKLRSLAEKFQAATPPASASKPQSKPLIAAPTKPDPLLTLRTERDARRRERDAARLALAQAQAEREAAVKARLLAETERDDAQKLAKKQTERIARLERQMAQARQTEARLVKALNEDKVSPPPAPRPRSAGPQPVQIAAVSAAWPAAVRHLLDKGKFANALALAADVLKTDGDDLEALQIAAAASEKLAEPRLALVHARRLLTLQLRRTDVPAASETLLALFRLVGAPEQAEPDVRAFLAALPTADSADVSSARLMLGRLRGLDPKAHDWLAGYLAERTSLGPVLMPPPGALGPDDSLPLSLNLGRPVTARHLTEAVDRAQTALVDAARSALAALKSSDAETSARVWAALEAAASDEPARLRPLRREPRGAAVVDGSNVAWFDQESLVQGKPRLRPLLAMRRTLWERGFFPVVLYADANLPYFIDDKPALLKMRDCGELTFVDAGTVADEVLLRVAKQMSAPLVTNDKMQDWDPEGEVRKVQYAISMSGEAHLLSEI